MTKNVTSCFKTIRFKLFCPVITPAAVGALTVTLSQHRVTIAPPPGSAPEPKTRRAAVTPAGSKRAPGKKRNELYIAELFKNVSPCVATCFAAVGSRKELVLCRGTDGENKKKN